MSEQYFAELYEWLTDAVDAALGLNQPKLPLEYITMMRAMEVAGVVTVKNETVH